jgi:hypothetical protein
VSPNRLVLKTLAHEQNGRRRLRELAWVPRSAVLRRAATTSCWRCSAVPCRAAAIACSSSSSPQAAGCAGRAPDAILHEFERRGWCLLESVLCSLL